MSSCVLLQKFFGEEEQEERKILYAFEYEDEIKLEPKKEVLIVDEPLEIKLKKTEAKYVDAFDAFVEDWIGTPYKYSGDTKNGTDCSGFTTQLYRFVFNYEFKGRSSRDLFAEVTPVKQPELQKGDLVFFKIKGRQIDHVGVYLNNGNFVHASTQRGVIVSHLEEPYYKLRFFSGGRINSLAP